MKKSFLITKTMLFLLLFVAMNSHAQDDFTLTYDDSGNRTGFTINVLELKTSEVIPDSLTEELVNTSLPQFTDVVNGTEIKVFPNPTSGLLTVEINRPDTGDEGHIVVYNNSGIRIFRQDYLNAINSIDLSTHPAGVYHMKIFSGSESVSRWKIIKH